MGLNKPSGNMYPWAYTWNPLAGECPHRCIGCYVGYKIAPWLQRMGSNKYYGSLRLIEKEFDTRLVVPEEYIVFVESCGDLFAYGVKDRWINRILNHLRKDYSQTTFLLQTKNPERYFDFDIPKNCILGTTLESNRDYHTSKAPNPKARSHVFYQLAEDYSNRLMVSIEPIMDFDRIIFADWIRSFRPRFVSVGADSGNNHFKEPSGKKLATFLTDLRTFTEVRVKDNLERLLR